VDSRTKDDLEVGLAEVADRISRTSILSLIRVRPALVQRAVPGETSLAGTLLGALAVRDRVSTDTNIAIAALHDGEVVSRTVLAGILTVAEFEKSLSLPLTGGAPFGVAGETHAKVFEGSGDSDHLFGRDVRWFGAFEHLEATSDLVESDLLGERTVVPDIDVESICVTFDESVVDWGCRGRQGEQRSEEPALSVHIVRNDCDGIAEV
jgi:hypothetical protein